MYRRRYISTFLYIYIYIYDVRCTMGVTCAMCKYYYQRIDAHIPAYPHICIHIYIRPHICAHISAEILAYLGKYVEHISVDFVTYPGLALCVALRGRHGPWLVHTWSVLGAARGRFGGAALVAARSAGAAGVTAGEEGSDARSMTLSF